MVYRVPGAFEIPVCAEYALRSTAPDALIALGVILRGETEHADLIGASVTDALRAAWPSAMWSLSSMKSCFSTVKNRRASAASAGASTAARKPPA